MATRIRRSPAPPLMTPDLLKAGVSTSHQLSFHWQSCQAWRQKTPDRDVLAVLDAHLDQVQHNRHHETSGAFRLLSAAQRPPDGSVSVSDMDAWIKKREPDLFGATRSEETAVLARITCGVPLTQAMNLRPLSFTTEQAHHITIALTNGTRGPGDAERLFTGMPGPALVPWMLQTRHERSTAAWHDLLARAMEPERIMSALVRHPDPNAHTLIGAAQISPLLSWETRLRPDGGDDTASRWLDRHAIAVSSPLRDHLSRHALRFIAMDECRAYTSTGHGPKAVPILPAIAQEAQAVLRQLPQSVRLAILDGQRSDKIPDVNLSRAETRVRYAPVYAALTHDLPARREETLAWFVAAHSASAYEPWFFETIAGMTQP